MIHFGLLALLQVEVKEVSLAISAKQTIRKKSSQHINNLFQSPVRILAQSRNHQRREVM